MKFCNTCETKKPFDMFDIRKASSDGLSAKCKTCQKVYDKARSGDTYREEARRIYAQTEEGRIAGNRAKAKYRASNPIKSKAHALVLRSIRAGKLFKEPCEECGSDEKIHAHHDDYTKPLNVRWLCAAHHSQWHAKNGQGDNPF